MYSIIIPLRLLTILFSFPLFCSSTLLPYFCPTSFCIHPPQCCLGRRCPVLPAACLLSFLPSFLPSFFFPFALVFVPVCLFPFFILLTSFLTLYFTSWKSSDLAVAALAALFWAAARHPLQPADLWSFCLAFVLFFSPFLSLFILSLFPPSISLSIFNCPDLHLVWRLSILNIKPRRSCWVPGVVSPLIRLSLP